MSAKCDRCRQPRHRGRCKAGSLAEVVGKHVDPNPATTVLIGAPLEVPATLGFSAWIDESARLTILCRRSMLPVVNCACCQLGLHAPPPLKL